MEVFSLPNKRARYRFTYGYLTPLLHLANKKEKMHEPLTFSDLLPLNPEYSSRSFANQDPSKFQRSVLWELIKNIGLPFYLTMLYHVVQIVITCVEPKFYKKFVRFLEENDLENLERGIWLAAPIVLLVIFQYLLNLFSEQMLSLSEKKANSILTSAIIAKALRLSSTEIEKLGHGKIMHLLEKRHRISGIIHTLGSLWADPIRALVLLLLLVDEAGPIFVVSLVFALISFSIGWVIARLRKRNNEVREKHSKNQTKEVTELIKGIKAIKMNVIEACASERCEKEFNAAKKCEIFGRLLGNINTGQKDLLSNAVVLVALLSILWDGETLTLSKVYAIIALYQHLRHPLFSFEEKCAEFVNMRIYLSNLESFLSLPEKTAPTENVEDLPGTIRFENVQVMCGERQNAKLHLRTVLEGINFEIHAGELIGIAGPVGIGKTLFLKTILNECMIGKGRVSAAGKIAYLSHDAWIVNDTLKNNVIMDKELVQEKYESIIKICQLNEDIELLAKGDQTEIGSRGINLSGGQRQRVALARALYSGGDIYLFDDSLCQLDPTIGAKIFNEVIVNFLKGKTRVFVTSNICWLPKIPRIVIFESRGIAGQGTYEALHKTNSAFIKLEAESLSKLIDKYQDQYQTNRVTPLSIINVPTFKPPPLLSSHQATSLAMVSAKSSNL
eukprot:TRINITY_DN1008_c0_g1_i2.p1 TRINITY_DN1008_c0_g1~~TRINITY_DN1008_c0_g1_i2.p1  ORF type:complete len:672 (-),score=46.28 TRINITY_DN1008_c0_g1_i2:3532-5547(-)